MRESAKSRTFYSYLARHCCELWKLADFQLAPSWIVEVRLVWVRLYTLYMPDKLNLHIWAGEKKKVSPRRFPAVLSK